MEFNSTLPLKKKHIKFIQNFILTSVSPTEMVGSVKGEGGGGGGGGGVGGGGGGG